MKEINRRDFVKMTGAAAVGLALSQIPRGGAAFSQAPIIGSTYVSKLTVQVPVQRCTLRSISMLNI